MRQSIQPTYDSRVSGPAYHITYLVNGKAITSREPISDPFVHARLTIGLFDLLRGLFRRSFVVEIVVGGDKDRIDDVLELDANTLATKSSRRLAFGKRIQRQLEDMSDPTT